MCKLLNWCPNNRTRKEPTCSYCGQGMCKCCRSFTSPEYCPNCKPLTNSVLAPAMLALLERVVEIDNVFDDNDPDKVVAWHKLTLDTKTLLKEAKEVKHGNP